MTTISTFEILPDEIMLHICQYLDDADVLYSLYNLNARLNVTITGYCRYVNLTAVGYKQFNYVATYVLPCIGYHVQSFLLNAHWETSISAQLFDNLFTLRLSILCPQLQKLTLSWFTSVKLFTFIDSLENFPHLSTLNIRGLSGNTADSLVPKVFSSNNGRFTIVSFDLASTGLDISEDATSIFYANIEELRINLTVGQALPRLFKLAPNLRRLSVLIYKSSNGLGFKERFTSLAPLTHLIDFQLCSVNLFWTFEEMICVLQLMPSLQKLAIDLRTKDKRFLDEKNFFMILPSPSVHISLFIRYYFSGLNYEINSSKSVRLLTACLLDEIQSRVIVHTLPCDLTSMVLRASIGKQMLPGWQYTQQVANLHIHAVTSSFDILLTLQHFRRIRKLSITVFNESEILPVPLSVQPVALWLPLLKRLDVSGCWNLFELLNASLNLEYLLVDFDCLKVLLDDESTCQLLKSRIVRLQIHEWMGIESNIVQRIAEVFSNLRFLSIAMKDIKLLIDSFVLMILSLWRSKSRLALGVRGSLLEETTKDLQQWIIDHFFHVMARDSFAVEYNSNNNWFNVWLSLCN